MTHFFTSAVVWVLGRCSTQTIQRLAWLMGRLTYALGIRRRVTLDNLAHAFPHSPESERRRTAKRAYVNMMLAVLEALAARKLSDEQVRECLVIENEQLVGEAFAEGKGVLIATAHFGNWELLGDVIARRNIPLHAVVRPLKGALNAQLVENRRRNGLGLISPRGAVRETLKRLKHGHMVAMLIDQVIAAKHGVCVPFFGQLASTNPALSLAAQRSGAPVLLAMAAREGDKLHLFLEGPFRVPDTGDRQRDVATHTAALTAAIERYIRRYPDQWLWLHRRWKVKCSDEGQFRSRAPALEQ
ncbi:MAG: lysophospholipid acyltransferase family protein [Myxococcaceae bacterium]